MASLPDHAEWLTDSNKAVSISLVSPTANGFLPVAKFHPKFTYPFFGEDEKIFGYKGLNISLRFRANDMRPHLQVSYEKKVKPSAGLGEPLDVVAVLRDGNFLPPVAFTNESDFDASSKLLADKWTPPGTLYSTINDADCQYEVWAGSLADEAIQQLNNRIQILVALFIEAGSYIGRTADSEDNEPNLSDADRWTVFVLYKTEPSTEKADKKSYTFVGFAAVYRFFYFKAPSSPATDWELPMEQLNLADLPCRTRIAHFVILPPFQAKGNGARLYKTIFDYYQQHSATQELTVESPSEAFDDLRDVCDLAFLRSVPEFNALSLDASAKLPESGKLPPLVVGSDKLELIRKKTKIAPRQFGRVLEMHLMSQLPDSVQPTLEYDENLPTPTKEDKHLEKIWKLFVQQRLFRHNAELISQIEPSQRIEKLRETLGSVELEYARLLAAYERASKPRLQPTGKRPLDAEPEAPNKKARVEGPQG
ncbi:Histone acetyltransferase type B, catalytic subunit [Ophiocordyceps camponoti-floridani]|uniref:Histone acetyltransferase type B catalytic subunit n=1 Tax=Ophiocordyceps camponoti-floridani TaxID=2030778 RepID=A0A8H4Q7F8_9HYPO|nr:Histone acetyltransferase type B, catalytic subunit [Ophiocordyceps camponoti-floridani]